MQQVNKRVESSNELKLFGSQCSMSHNELRRGDFGSSLRVQPRRAVERKD